MKHFAGGLLPEDPVSGLTGPVKLKLAKQR
jgi:hypothetical protein